MKLWRKRLTCVLNPHGVKSSTQENGTLCKTEGKEFPLRYGTRHKHILMLMSLITISRAHILHRNENHTFFKSKSRDPWSNKLTAGILYAGTIICMIDHVELIDHVLLLCYSLSRVSLTNLWHLEGCCVNRTCFELFGKREAHRLI